MADQMGLFENNERTTGKLRINFEFVQIECKSGYAIVQDADGWASIADTITHERYLPSYALTKGYVRIIP